MSKVSTSSMGTFSLFSAEPSQQKSLLAMSTVVVSSMDVLSPSRCLCGVVMVIEAEFIPSIKLK